MLPDELPGWVLLLGGSIPSIGMGIWQFLKWWREAETTEAREEREERERREDRAKAASQQIWAEVQRELDRAYQRIAVAEREAAWWESQARAQHGIAWEMRGLCADARQAFMSLRTRVGTMGAAEDVPEAWRRPLEVPRVETPPVPAQRFQPGQSQP